MFFLVLLVLFSLFFKGAHLLSVLISLEFLALIFFFLFLLGYIKMFSGLNILLALLMVLGCESVMGLVLFVFVTRFYSKDYFLGSGLTPF